MSIGRKALWIAYGCLFVFHTVLLFSPPPVGEWAAGEIITADQSWAVAGRFLVAVNVFFPVVAGILTADRMQRDFRLGMRELQDSTPLSSAAYVTSKYLGVLASYLLPVFVWVMAIGVTMVAIGHASASILAALPIAFAAITIPAFAFVVAFSIACPLTMPVSVYQVLFTGYWFWANFIPPKLFPTLNGTVLTPSGIYALQAFFDGVVSTELAGSGSFTAGDAALNLAVLTSCVISVLFVVTVYLSRRARAA